MADSKPKVFSTPTCPWCNMLKQHLDEHDIDYESVDVSQDRESAMKMFKKSKQQGVPQMWIGDEVIVGFDRDRINKLLKIEE